MKTLPEDMIFEILLRLPVKSLLRFGSVSKPWLSLISDPYFAKLHFELSSQHTPRILHTVALEARSVDFSASLNDDSATVKLDFPLCKSATDVVIVGSCRGFLLLELDWELFLVWNPSTGACKQIPEFPSSCYMFLCGFGYDASTDDYLIVVGYDYTESPFATNLAIFSVRTNSWEKLEDRSYPYVSLTDDPGTPIGSVLNGAIHWLVSSVEPEVPHGAIIAFDLTARTLRELSMPDDFNDESCDLKVLGGCLSLIDTNSPDQIEIWMMKEYGVKSSWAMYITVSLVQMPTHSFSPICITKDGQVVGIYDGQGLIKCNENWGYEMREDWHRETGLTKCNEKGELLEHREYRHYDEWLEVEATACVYTETLLSLPCGQ